MISPGPDENLGEAEAAAVLAAEDILSLDDIPDENQQTDCFSCGETMIGLFCHSCGQKNDDFRRSIFSLLSEAFASFFSLENRMWRTWRGLILKPGKVSREFSDGKRTNWSSPVRMYLALSILLFGYMSLTETRIFSLRTDIVPKAEFNGPVDTLNDASVELKYDFGFFRRQAEIDKLNQNMDFDRVSRLMKGIPRQVFVFEDNLEALGLTPSDELLVSSGSWPAQNQIDDESETTTSARELAIGSYSEKLKSVVSSYNVLLATTKTPEKIINQILQAEEQGEVFDLAGELRLSENKTLRQLASDSVASIDTALEELGLTRADVHGLPFEIRKGFNLDLGESNINGIKLTQNDVQGLADKILKNPALLNEGLSKYLPRIMFLMMPFAAVIGLVFIRDRKRALLYDHLVHATYIHAVTFALLLILILLSQWTSIGGTIQVFLIAIAIYLPLSARGMFKRGWIKSIFASYTIAFFYALVMFIVITVLTVQSITNALKAGQGLL